MNRQLITIIVTVLVDTIGIGILVPVLPRLFTDPASSQYLLASGTSAQTGLIYLGLLIALYPLCMFLASPVLGQLSDRYGRRKVLALCLAGTALGYFLFAYAVVIKSLWLLFAARALDGITAGNIPVAQAALADVTKPEDRAKTFGLLGAAFGVGFILGPALGGLLSDKSVIPFASASLPFWFAGALAAFNTVQVLVFFPETRANTYKAFKFMAAFVNIAHAYSAKALRPLFTTSFLFQAGFSFYTTFASAYLIQRYAFGEANLGFFFAFIGICIAIVQVVLVRNLVPKYGEAAVLLWGLVVTSVGVLLTLLPTAAWQQYAIVPIITAGIGMASATVTALVSNSAGPEVQGEVLGINASVQALAQALPPLVAGFAAARFGIELPIVLASVVTMLGAIVFTFTYKPVVFHGEGM